MIGLYAVVLRDITSIYTASINLAALLVLVVALYKTELTAIWLGFLTGLVLTAGSPGTIGWYGLMYGGLGLVGYHVRERLNLESLYAKLLLVFGGTLLVNILVLPISGTDAFFYRLATVALAGAVYTTAVGYVFFLFKEDVITFKKIKSIF
jgi:cell shape-determining protein MreD